MDLYFTSGKWDEHLDPPPPLRPRKEVRVSSPERGYVVDVHIERTADHRDVPVGVTVWRQGRRGSPEPVSARDVKRLPLATLMRAAIAYGTWDLREVDRESKRLTLPRSKTGHTLKEFKNIAAVYRKLEERGERPVPKIAARMRVPPNRVHQWVHRMRYELKDENGAPLLPPPPPRKKPSTRRKS